LGSHHRELFELSMAVLKLIRDSYRVMWPCRFIDSGSR
jgi:hypothetical protein